MHSLIRGRRRLSLGFYGMPVDRGSKGQRYAGGGERLLLDGRSMGLHVEVRSSEMGGRWCGVLFNVGRRGHWCDASEFFFASW